jgi:hypothetical protein
MFSSRIQTVLKLKYENSLMRILKYNPTGQARRAGRRGMPRRRAGRRVLPRFSQKRALPPAPRKENDTRRDRNTQTHPLHPPLLFLLPVAASPDWHPGRAHHPPGRRARPWTACTVRTPASPPRGPSRRR